MFLIKKVFVFTSNLPRRREWQCHSFRKQEEVVYRHHRLNLKARHCMAFRRKLNVISDQMLIDGRKEGLLILELLFQKHGHEHSDQKRYCL
jgi:hypothetical protein